MRKAMLAVILVWVVALFFMALQVHHAMLHYMSGRGF